ncbi:MAG TPA: CoA transferase [Pseudonocardiaceae bacterium]|nr:CoA transferase [Pseudonocardiaceae bacterium]
MTALTGITMLEIGDHVSAPTCGAILADLGADVIKLEPPRHGDSARILGPFADGVVDLEHSVLFAHLNAGKRGVTLDLTMPSAGGFLRALLPGIDVVVDNMTHRPEFGGRYHDDWLRECNADLVIARLSPFGRRGPRAGWTAHEISISAASGFSATMGTADREPLALSDAAVGGNAGLYCAAAILVAVLGGAIDQGGESIDISEEEALLAAHTASDVLGWALARSRPRRDGSRQTGDRFIHENVACRDGMAHVSMVIPEQRRNLAAVVAARAPELAPRLDPDDVDGFVDVVREWLPTMTQAELLDLELEHNIGVLPVLEPARFHELLDADRSGPATILRDPLVPPRPAPTLGQHNAEVWGALPGVTPEVLIDMFQTGLS